MTSSGIFRRPWKIAVFLLVSLSFHDNFLTNCSAVDGARPEGDDDNSSVQLPFVRKPRQSHLIRPSSTKKDGSHRSPTKLSLAERAQSLSVDPNTSFVRRLKQQEEQLSMETTKGAEVVNYPASQGVVLLLAFGSLVIDRQNGICFDAIHDLLSGSLSTLALAWMPAILLQGGWVELLSLTAVLMRPTVRHYVVQEILPKAAKTLQKLVLAEVWRRIWQAILPPLPKPLLVPSKNDKWLRWLPHWVQEGLQHALERVDKLVQGSLRKSIEQAVTGRLGIFYESVSQSMLELSILVDESATSIFTEKDTWSTETDNSHEYVAEDPAEDTAADQEANDDEDGATPVLVDGDDPPSTD